MCALFGREHKDEPFLSLWDAPGRGAMTELLDVVTDEAGGVVAAVTSRTPEGWTQDLELLLLPLSHRGDTHARLIGSLAPLSAPFWLGTSRLDTLTLGGLRHLDAATDRTGGRAADRRRARPAQPVHRLRRRKAVEPHPRYGQA